MWVLVSFSGKIIGEPLKSEAALAKKLGFSQQYINRQLKKAKNIFDFEGQKVVVKRKMEFSANGKEFETKSAMADFLGVSRDVIDRVFKKSSSGTVKTPQGEITVSKIAGGGSQIPLAPKPLPVIRVIWNNGWDKQEFSSFAAAAKELKIDPKTIPNALKVGRDSFTRKSDGQTFQLEIPGEKITPKEVYKKQIGKIAKKWAQAMDKENYDEAEELSEQMDEVQVPHRSSESIKNNSKGKDAMAKYLKETLPCEVQGHVAEEAQQGNEEMPIPEDLEYLGFGLWTKKSDDVPDEEDPFIVYHFSKWPGLSQTTCDTFFCQK